LASRFDFYTTGHSFHRFMNPTNLEKMMELGFALGLMPREDGPEKNRLANLNLGMFPGARVAPSYASVEAERTVLDIACGKGGVSYLLAENFHAKCTGVDASQGEVEQAKARQALTKRPEMVQFTHGEAIPFVSQIVGSGQKFDACMCIGATFAFGDFSQTLLSLAPCLGPHGSIAIGEATLNDVPGVEGFREECQKNSWDVRLDHEYIEIARGLNLELVYLIDSGLSDWDRYESLQWLALYDNLSQHPHDETASTYWQRKRDQQINYIRNERKFLGWKIFVFRPSVF